MRQRKWSPERVALTRRIHRLTLTVLLRPRSAIPSSESVRTPALSIPCHSRVLLRTHGCRGLFCIALLNSVSLSLLLLHLLLLHLLLLHLLLLLMLLLLFCHYAAFLEYCSKTAAAPL